MIATNASLRNTMTSDEGWSSILTAIADADPEFANAFVDFAGLNRVGRLSLKTRALITFGLNISVSHMNAPAAREAARAARNSGATLTELQQVSQLVVLLGIHSVVLVAEFLADKVPATETASHVLAAAKAAYVASRGFIPAPLERFMNVDAPFVDAYRRLSEIPFRRDVLATKDVELIVIALDASVNHLHSTGCKAHINAALAAGASGGEIAEALEMAAAMAGQGSALGFSIAAEAFAAD